ncbi:MAG: dipeptidyl aminopeptidase/acylaminoacyl peptidase, partial [Bacteroidia bacterium]
MKIIKLFFLITFYLTLTNCFAQKELDFFNYWQYYSDNENALYKHFSKIAFDQLENRRLEVSQLTTKEDWLERQSKVKNKLMEMIGPFPDKTPLNARVVDVIKKEGYRIEKIIYQSRPGYYVTSALYIPNKAKQKSPSIFYACGHTVEGFRAGTYQHIIVNLVKKGFVVFTIDPMGQGERFEYWDEKTGQSKFPIPDHEHSYPGAQCLLAGYSTGNNFIWDGIRGVDYMLTRKEI